LRQRPASRRVEQGISVIVEGLKKFLSTLKSNTSAASSSGRQAWRTDARESLLDDLRLAIRMECYDEALRLANWAGGETFRDAAILNLHGVVHEKRGEWKLAKKFYGRAIRCDHRYAPSQQNMRRIYELMTLGRSDQPIILGDERPALGKLILKRAKYIGSLPDPLPARR
jgi:tetratricopeptide (TPR) repeat protein